MKRLLLPISCLLLMLLCGGCYQMRMSKGGGEGVAAPARKIQASDIALIPGYRIEAVATGLTFPTGITFDDEGAMYVVESGYAYGEVWDEPHLIRIDNGAKTIVATGERNGPWNGVAYHEGNFYVSEGGQGAGGKILRISPEGNVTAIAEGLPSLGDHHTNAPLIHNGYVYFGQGTATNSAVVGEDNASFGWLKRHTQVHDIPCRDVVLSGKNYESANVLTDGGDDKIRTGAFSPFGTTTSPGQIVKGSVPCNGAVMRVPLEGGDVELVSWGLRNPFGLALSEDGKLYVTENAFDDRGSRPVWGSGDVLWEVKENAWYGWPDFSEGRSVAKGVGFKVPGGEVAEHVLQKHPGTPPEPIAVFGVHSSANGFDFSESDAFGFRGDAFVSLFGDMASGVGKVWAPVGFKVVRVNVKDGIIRDFAVNKGKRNGPASWLERGGLERPVDVKFSPDGRELYIVDFGILRMDGNKSQPLKGTGVIWRVVRDK